MARLPFLRARNALLAGDVLGRLHVVEAAADDRLGAEAIGIGGGAVDRQHEAGVALDHEHRHRIVVEQQPERLLALLHLGDVDADADEAAVGGAALVDQDAAAVGQALLEGGAGIAHAVHATREPFLLAPGGFRILATRDADPERVLQAAPDREQVGAALIDLGVALVPEQIAPLGIQDDDALRQRVERLADGGERIGAVDLAPAHASSRNLARDNVGQVSACGLEALRHGPPLPSILVGY